MILRCSIVFQYLMKFALYEVKLNVVTAGNIKYEKNSKLPFPKGYPEDKTFNQNLKVKEEYEWSSWTVSTCSRSCGAGLQLKQRSCKYKRRGFEELGYIGEKHCPGKYKEYTLCNTESCRKNQKDAYREEQCSQYNGQTYGGINYEWKPVNYNIEKEWSARDQCKLLCEGRYGVLSMRMQFAESVLDGTSCTFNANEQGVCLKGECTRIGCDGLLNSTSSKDICGVCDGDNSTCEYFSGFINKTLSIGYHTVLELPTGASLLSIADMGKNYSLFAARTASTIHFAGARHSKEDPTVYNNVAGTSFKYYQHQQGVSFSEKLRCEGPITSDVFILMFSSKSGEEIFLKYSYVLFKSVNDTELRHNNTSTNEIELLTDHNQTSEQFVRYRNKKFHRSEHYPVNAVSDPGPPIYTTEPGIGSRPRVEISDEAEYFWQTNLLAPCSATCTMGTTSSYAQCYRRRDQIVVDDKYCATAKKPNHEKRQCIGEPCPARWVVGSWSGCSVSCGKGSQNRSVRCWRVLAPGFDSSVHDHLCDYMSKPITSKLCSHVDCVPQWLTTMWKECSARCGKGMQSRHVLCLSPSADGRCDRRKRPLVAKQCNMGSCSNIWVVSHWSNCSGDCGNGTSHRSVQCRDPVGNFLNDRHCDQQLRPLSMRLCSNTSESCPSRWIPQDWTACSVTCGEGVTSRAVVCEAVEEDNYVILPEADCEHLYKPPTRGQCQERPCPATWYTSQWSECSQTCGSVGVRLRQVHCYRDNQPSVLCNNSVKPHDTETCQLSRCEQPKNKPGTKCMDLLNTGCNLVIRTRLCNHWYYKKACCKTCHQSTLSEK